MSQNMARHFNGSPDYMSTSSINLSAQQKMAICFWLYWDSFLNDDQICNEFGTNYAGGTGRWAFIPNGSAKTAWEIAWNPAGSGYLAWFTRPSAAVWHHYVINFDASQTTDSAQLPTVYVDGISQSLSFNGSSGSAFNWGNQALYLMSRAGSSLFAKGRMADYVIFHGVNLSTAQALALAKGVSPNQIRRDIMKIYLPVWGTSTTEADLSGGGHNATVTGSTVVAHAPTGRYNPRKRFLRQFYPHPGCSNIGFTKNAGVNSEYPLSQGIDVIKNSTENSGQSTQIANGLQNVKPVWVQP